MFQFLLGFPIPFARRVRIEVDGPGKMYYQIQYHQFPSGTPVRTFSRQLDATDQAALVEVLIKPMRTPELPDDWTV